MIAKLEDCTPDFVRKCFPEHSGNVICDHNKGIIFFLLPNFVLIHRNYLALMSIYLETPPGFQREECRWWYTNGKKYAIEFNKNGVQHGEMKIWDIEGTLRNYEIYENGKLICRHLPKNS